MKGIASVSALLPWQFLDRSTRSHLDAAKKQKPSDPTKTPPELALHSYIDRVRAQHAAEVSTAGSIWSPEGRLVRLGTDAKAARMHDVVSIVVIESLAASTDGQVKERPRVECQFQRHRSLFGALKASNSLQNLVGQNSASGLTAQGQSTTNSSLATTFGGEVVDVLPNGMLVVQATRQLTFSQQTQIIKLRGLVRPEDVSAQNQVLSTCDDRSGTRSYRQGNCERLDLPPESAGALAGKAAGVLRASRTQEGENQMEQTESTSAEQLEESAPRRFRTSGLPSQSRSKTSEGLQWACSSAWTLLAAVIAVAAGLARSETPGQMARVKDVATIEGIRDNQLVGYGLVVGLRGTGDSSQTVFPAQTLISALERMGVTVPQTGSNSASNMQVKNMAAVFVVATLPPFSRPGYRVDITASSAGDARSLEGGILLMTPLYGPDGQIYAQAQGALGSGRIYEHGCRQYTATQSPHHREDSRRRAGGASRAVRTQADAHGQRDPERC